MKKYLISIAILILLAIIFFLFFYKTEKPIVDDIIVDNVDTVLEPKDFAFASVLEKDFYVNKLYGKEEILDRKEVLVGDVVETSSTGRGVVESLGGNVTVVDYSTKFKIQKNKKNPTEESIFLSEGNLWARVTKVFGKGEFYEIETQNAVAIVRGTYFGVSYKNGKTILKVSEGKVLMVPVASSSRERFFDKAVLVPFGNKAVADLDLSIIVSKLTDNDKKDYWYVYNNKEVKSTTTNTVKPTITKPPTNNIQTTQTTVATTTTVPPTPTPVSIASTLSLISASPTNVTKPDYVYLRGTGFGKVTVVVLGKNTVLQSDMKIDSDTTLHFSTANIPAGSYSIVSLVDITQKIVVLNTNITIVEPPPPPPTTKNVLFNTSPQ